MQNVVLTIHLILALLLTGVVLLQRSEGGGLGMGGGGGGGVMTGRQAANVFTRLTWIFGIGLFCTSVALTIIAAREASTGSIIDQLGGNSESQEAPATNLPGLGTYAPPPATSGQPVTPPAPEAAAPATEAPAADAATAPATDAAPAPAAPVTPPAAEAPAEAAPAAEAPAAEAPAAETAPAPETPAEPAAPATN